MTQPANSSSLLWEARWLLLSLAAVVLVQSAAIAGSWHIEPRTLKQRAPSYDVYVKYPHVSGGRHSSRLNAIVDKLVKSKVSEFKETGITDRGSRFSMSYTAPLLDEKAVSFEFHSTTRSSPSDRPLESDESLNFSPRLGRELHLRDLFLDSIDCEEILKTFVFVQMTKSYDLDIDNVDGMVGVLLPDQDWFEHFTLSRDGIDIHIGSTDQESAAAMPFTTIHVPFWSIVELMSPKSPVYRLAANAKAKPGYVRLKRKDWRDALDAEQIAGYSRLIARNPDDAQLYTERSLLYEHLGKAELSKADADRAVELARPPQSQTAVSDATGTESYEIPVPATGGDESEMTTATKAETSKTAMSPLERIITGWLMTALFLVCFGFMAYCVIQPRLKRGSK